MPRPIAIDDFMKLRLVSDPQIAPDGSRIACVVKRIERDKNKYVSQIWLAVGQEDARPFTSEDSSSHYPRWSPDGRQLAFLSDRQKPKSQIYLVPADGGEARALTKLETEGSIGSFRWSPDGSKIAFTFRATPAPYRKDAADERKEKGLSSPVRQHARLFYRLDGMGYFDDEYFQVWIADAMTGAARQLTAGPFACNLPTWSPDSQTLAFLSDRRDDGDIAPAQDDIWTIAVPDVFAVRSGLEGEGAQDGVEYALTRIASPPGAKSELMWSPDGSRFAYVGNPDPSDTWGTTNARVFVLPAGGSETAQDLTGHSDRSVGHLTTADSHEIGAGDEVQWSGDGKRLYFPVSHFGVTTLNYVEADTDVANPVIHVAAGSGGEVGDFSVAQDGITIAFTEGCPTMPHELYSTTLTPSFFTEPTYLRTQVNQDWLAEVDVATPEMIGIVGSNGVIVRGWLLKPANMQPGEKYPLVVYVHGGPHLQYGRTFYHEFQWLAAQGFVVAYINPRGSKGYGEAHAKAIAGNWGSVDYDDIMAATDWACGLDFVDASRTAIMGGSYGGYMTAWAIGHSDRFRCAIADRLVANLHSMSGTCDFSWRPDHPFKGNGWSDPAQLWRCSPLAHAGSITTPLLLIHCDGDLRCPAEQAEQLFAALRHQRKTVEYVRFPAEASHGLSRSGPPDLRLERLQVNINWLNRWLKP